MGTHLLLSAQHVGEHEERDEEDDEEDDLVVFGEEQGDAAKYFSYSLDQLNAKRLRVRRPSTENTTQEWHGGSTGSTHRFHSKVTS